MVTMKRLQVPSWTSVVPVVALVALALTWESKPAAVVLAGVAVLLAGSVLAAVHHAEVVAHRVGEPFGSLRPEKVRVVLQLPPNRQRGPEVAWGFSEILKSPGGHSDHFHRRPSDHDCGADDVGSAAEYGLPRLETDDDHRLTFH